VLVLEQNRTRRQQIALEASDKKASIDSSLQAQQLAHTRSESLYLFLVFMASHIGTRLRMPGGKFSAMFLVVFIRYLWLRAKAAGNGSFLRGLLQRGLLQRSLKGSLVALLEGPAAHLAAPGGRVEAAVALRAGRCLPLLGPGGEAGWISQRGPDGRTFWHHVSLGPAPWALPGPPPPPSAPCTDGADGVAAGSAASGAASGAACESDGASDGGTEDGGTADGRSACPGPGAGCAPAPNRAVRPPTRGGSGAAEAAPLGALLSNWGLAEYADALGRNGYDPETMKALSEEEVEEMLGVIGCKPEHDADFRKALECWR